MELEFTVLETLFVYYALTNAAGDVDYWDKERDAEPKFILDKETQDRLGIDYEPNGFSVTLPNAGALTRKELWAALSAESVEIDLTRADVEVALTAVKRCQGFTIWERDPLFRLVDKLQEYLDAFSALDALASLPPSARAKAMEMMEKS